MDLTFGVNLSSDPDVGPAAAARSAEAAGFDVVTVADHVGAPSPLVALAAAAAVTDDVRLRSYVLDVGFWNAGLLSRDVATLDALSGGRVEVGLGAGHMRQEHEAVGLPFPPYRERLAALDAFAADLAARLGDPAPDAVLDPAPVQRPVPVFLAAMSTAGLAVAAGHGTTVALSGLLQVPGAPGGAFTVASSGRTDEAVQQVRQVRTGRGLPPARLDALLQQVVVDRDPEAAAGELAAELAARAGSRLPVELLLDSPFVLFAASPGAAAEELQRRAERWGITSWCTHARSGPALARVIDELR